MHNRLIFLDIDGVLNTCQHGSFRCSLNGQEYHAFCPKTVAALNRITDETGAKIVVSSTWRLKGLDVMRAILGDQGVTGEVIGLTCRGDFVRATVFRNVWEGEWPDRTKDEEAITTYERPCERGDEIAAWLAQFSYRPYPAPEGLRFLILDDDAHMAHLRPYLVRTRLSTGLTDEQADFAIRFFNAPPDERFWEAHYSNPSYFMQVETAE